MLGELNEKFVFGVLGLVPARLPLPSTLSLVRVRMICRCMTAVGENFENLYFTRWCSDTFKV